MTFEARCNSFCNFRVEKGPGLDSVHTNVLQRGRYLDVNESVENHGGSSTRNTSLLLNEVRGHNMPQYTSPILCSDCGHDAGSMTSMRCKGLEIGLLKDGHWWRTVI